ncbi:MAG: chromate transporter [Spirochaetia bacterium]
MILLRLFLSFLLLGAFSFGGGYAMIPLIQEEIVETHGWISMEEFTDLISVSQATPGPVAVNTATYIGYRIAGFPGALIATCGVIIIPVLVVMGIFWLTVKHKNTVIMNGALKGLRPVLIALIVYSAYTIGTIAFTGWLPIVLAAAALIVLLFTPVNPVYLVLAAAFFGVFMI